MENNINHKNDIKIKTICEFLFFDKYKDTATFQRFEECFQPLFKNINISLKTVFKEICGQKKKYITYKRLRKAFFNYINNKDISEDTKLFFDKLFNSILKEEKSYIGKDVEGIENIYIFSTIKIGGKSKNITKIQILTDEEENINGINLEYDGIYESKMYPEIKVDELYLSLEINLKIINDTYNDAVTHIFGTINEETGYINFLGFKCISGKNLFIGFPKGEGFLFGQFGTKFHNLKIQMTKEGISKFEPIFINNPDINYFLRHIPNQNMKEDEIIKEEEKLIDLKEKVDDDNDNFDKILITPIIEDNILVEKDLDEKYCGNDYKEIIEQTPRKWISKTTIGKDKIYLNLKESIQLYEKEKNKIKTKTEIGLRKNSFSYIANKLIFHKKKKLTTKWGIKEDFILNESDRKATQKKWDGKLDNDVNSFTFFNKNNYHKLKELLGKMIHEAFIKKNKDKYNPIQQAILNKLVPFPGSYPKNEDNNKNPETEKKQKKLNTKKFKGAIMEENNIENVNNEEDDDDINRKETIYSDAAEFYNYLEKEDSNEQDLKNSKLEKNKDLEKCQLSPQLKGLEKMNFLSQTIKKSVSEAENVLKDINNLNFSNSEQIKIYQKLKKNEKIVESLNENNENIEIDIQTPDNPENMSLGAIQKYLDDLKKLKEDKNIKKENRQKIEQLYILYLKQKNILIEKETKKTKEELSKGLFINIGKYINEEKDKRRKAQIEEQKEIEKIQKEKEEKEKEEYNKKNIKEQSIVDLKIEIKIFRDQKKPNYTNNWEDNFFSHNKYSICDYNSKGWIFPRNVGKVDMRNWDKIEKQWCRVGEIESMKYHEVFVDGATVDDIQQGNIGDCYFLSTIGSLCSQKINFIEKLFLIKRKSQTNVYGILFHINGVKKVVLIDDYLPYIQTNQIKTLFFSSSFQKEIWVSLIEKAWAKINGGYARITGGGFTYEVFDVLTEAYTEHIIIDKKKKEELWDKIQNAKNNNYPMTAGTPSRNSIMFLDFVGLVYGHGYTVIDIFSLNTGKEKVKLIKLKNPWGNREFSGDWSDYSKKWTPYLKKQCNFVKNENDGIFHMSYDDFIYYFFTLDICKLEQSYKTRICKIKKEQAKKCQVIKIIIDKNFPKTFINLYQKNSRILRKDKTYFPDPVLAYIILAKEEDNELKFINSANSLPSLYNNNYKMHIAIEEDLTPGTYYLFCDVNYRYLNPFYKSYGYTITFYSKEPINNFENITNKINTSLYLEKVITNYCLEQNIKFDYKRGFEI